MDKTDAKQAMKELTMVLLYLSRFTEGEKFFQGRISMRGRVTILMC